MFLTKLFKKTAMLKIIKTMLKKIQFIKNKVFNIKNH